MTRLSSQHQRHYVALGEGITRHQKLSHYYQIAAVVTVTLQGRCQQQAFGAAERMYAWNFLDERRFIAEAEGSDKEGGKINDVE